MIDRPMHASFEQADKIAGPPRKAGAQETNCLRVVLVTTVV